MGPLQKSMPIKEGVQLLERAFSHGVNFVDTAEIYGTYPYIKEALAIKPDTVICTKSYAYDKETADKSLRAAFSGIGRDYIDIFLLHEQESGHTIRGHMEAVKYLHAMKAKGHIGAVGLSTHYIACMKAALMYDELEVLFPLINKAGVGIADGSSESMLKQIITAHDLGKGVFAMKPLGGGHLIPDREDALKFILGLDCIDSVAIGMQSIAEVDYNCMVFSGGIPDKKIAEETQNASRRLLIHDWCEGCGACVSICRNGALALVDGRASVNHEKCALCGYCARVCPQFCIKVV